MRDPRPTLCAQSGPNSRAVEQHWQHAIMFAEQRPCAGGGSLTDTPYIARACRRGKLCPDD